MAKVTITYPPILLPAAEAAAYLGQISSRKLDELQAEGRITPRALDGTRCYLRTDLDAFADELPAWETKRRKSA